MTPHIFKEATFEIKSGTSTVIVGPSGSGKSTTIQLLNRLYDVEAGGQILFGQTALTEMNLEKLRSQIGYVGQEPVLIVGSIRENLSYGKTDATEDEMWEALRLASASDFVKDLEGGLDQYVGAGSIMNLSGGQK